MGNKVLFFAGVALVCSGLAGPPAALALGLCFGLLLRHPFAKSSRKWSGWLLQLSVVALGFGMNFGEVVRAGKAGFLFTAIGVTFVMTVGLVLGRALRVGSKTAFLITAGTAICGGSAIAALVPVLEPGEDELAMALGTIFTLNSVALFAFPAIGLAAHMTQTQFGLWSALAIHDTSSVVGAAAKFGPRALAVATVVKLTRALWIIPVVLVTAWSRKSRARVKLPWFIPAFCLAAISRTAFSGLKPEFSVVVQGAHIALALTLFLIGTGISLNTVKKAGLRVMAQGVLLWIVVALVSLPAIRGGWIRL